MPKTEDEVQNDILENSINTPSFKEENSKDCLENVEVQNENCQVYMVLSESKDVNVNRPFENERFIDQDKF